MGTRRRRNLARKTGLSPGTPVFVGEQHLAEMQIKVVRYDEDHHQVTTPATLDEALRSIAPSGKTWIDICGVHDTAAIEKLGKHFNLHPLVIEDIPHTDQRVKVDEYDGYVFIVVKDLALRQNGEPVLESDQISLILMPHCLISFQERPGDSFDAVRRRLAVGFGRMRKLGVDYLAYALLDAIVDEYFVLLERFGEKIEDLEEVLIESPAPPSLASLYGMRRNLLLLRRAAWPLREIVARLERHDISLIQESTRIFLRDLYDHSVQVIDAVETARDLLSSMVEIYLSNMSNRMNEVMKRLTAITAIFIPLTFIAGVYGMNFEHMPELQWRYGYLLVWGVMLTLATIITVIFRKKKWM